MTETSYRVVPRAKRRFDVEMANPNGRRKMIEGFGSEHEANAWIVQTQRMIRATGPWTPLAPRKPGVASSIHVPPAPPPLQSEQQGAQDARNRAASRRADARRADAQRADASRVDASRADASRADVGEAHERSIAKP